MAPWNAAEFAAKHFKKATPKQAKKGASVANAILASEGEGKVGIAIATGIARAKGKKRKGKKRKAPRLPDVGV